MGWSPPVELRRHAQRREVPFSESLGCHDELQRRRHSRLVLSDGMMRVETIVAKLRILHHRISAVWKLHRN